MQQLFLKIIVKDIGKYDTKTKTDRIFQVQTSAALVFRSIVKDTNKYDTKTETDLIFQVQTSAALICQKYCQRYW